MSAAVFDRWRATVFDRRLQRFSRLAYQPSNSTHRGAKPRALAISIISRKWSFLVLPSALL
jgi:hypothetical protein